MNKAYIVTGYRTAVGKAGRGGFKFSRPDDLAAEVIKKIMESVHNLDPARVDDVIVGNATPEAEQGLNIGRMISLMALGTDKVPGMTVNRYCASGLETMAIAKAKIEAGISDCIIAGGTESMSIMAMGGWRIVPNAKVGKTNPDWYWGMGLTAEAVAKEFGVSRDEQDAFAVKSQEKALSAIAAGRFKEDIVPIEVEHIFLDEKEKRQVKKFVVDTDEGPRAGTTMEALARLRPVFAADGSVTAGNASQTSDGAAFVLMMSEAMVKELNLEPVAQLLSYKVVGVPPRIMGIGPVDAIPAAIAAAGLKLNDINLFELNEAFAAQVIACMKVMKDKTLSGRWGIDEVIGEVPLDKLNVNGGGIALGHPVGSTGSRLVVTLAHELKRRKQKYGVASLCIGGGQGGAVVIENLKV
jgi:acetyl-CoA acyltransferase